MVNIFEKQSDRHLLFEKKFDIDTLHMIKITLHNISTSHTKNSYYTYYKLLLHILKTPTY